MSSFLLMLLKHMIVTTIAIILTMTGRVALAADVDMVSRGSSRILMITGVIEAGDYRKVVDWIADDGNHEGTFLLRSRRVFVDSPGGSVDEAMKLARLFRDIYAKVTVVKGCSSACFLLYAGAVERLPLGEIGLHNPYLDARSSSQLSVKPLEAQLRDRKSTRLNSSHRNTSRMPSSA